MSADRDSAACTPTGDATCTIITVTRQNRRGLIRTLESLRGLGEHFEHIVIDGDSTDGSPEWVRSNAAIAATTVISEPDRGIYDAMNKGLAIAQGRFVQFLNAGDVITSTSVLHTCVQELSQSPHKWLLAGMLVRGSLGRVRAAKHPRRYSWLRETFVRYRVSHPATIAETVALRELGGFDTSYQIAADYKLLTALGRKERPLVSRLRLVEFELGGLSDRSYAKSIRECSRARNELFGYGRAIKALDETWTNVLIVGHSIGRFARFLR